MAAAVFPAGIAFAYCPVASRMSARCDSKLRRHDGADVFALTPNQVLALARDLGATEPLLRRGFPRWTYERTLPLRKQLKRAAHLGRVYSRAFRADPSDNSLPQEAAFENSLVRLRRVARAAGVPACSVRLAQQ